MENVDEYLEEMAFNVAINSAIAKAIIREAQEKLNHAIELMNKGEVEYSNLEHKISEKLRLIAQEYNELSMVQYKLAYGVSSESSD